MTRAISAGHPGNAPYRARYPGSILGLALLLAGCGMPVVKHQVMTPPPSSPRVEFYLEKPEVQSREVGDEAWRRNEQLSQSMSEALRDAFLARGKKLGAAPAGTVRSRIYLGYGQAPVKAPGQRRPVTYIEVRLELLDDGGKHARYSTHTRSKIRQAPFGWGPGADEIIQNTLRQAAEDFVSRL